MTVINAGASLSINLQIAPYESVKPGYWAGIQEELEAGKISLRAGSEVKYEGTVSQTLEETVPDSFSDDEVIARISELQNKCRELCEDKIDRDISLIRDKKVFQIIREKKESK